MAAVFGMHRVGQGVNALHVSQKVPSLSGGEPTLFAMEALWQVAGAVVVPEAI